MVGVDIDQTRIKFAKHNAKLYNVQDRIDFVHSDFFDIRGIKPDIVFLAPPWGGIDYSKNRGYSPLKSVTPDLFRIIEHSLTLSPNLVLLLPKNTELADFAELFDKVLTKMKAYLIGLFLISARNGVWEQFGP